MIDPAPFHESIEKATQRALKKQQQYGEIYMRMRDKAAAYIADQSTEENIMISKFADDSGIDYLQACELVLQKHNQIWSVVEQIKVLRDSKQSIKDSMSSSEAYAVQDQIIEQINSLGELIS